MPRTKKPSWKRSAVGWMLTTPKGRAFVYKTRKLAMEPRRKFQHVWTVALRDESKYAPWMDTGEHYDSVKDAKWWVETHFGI